MSDKAIEAAVDAFRASTFDALTRDECRDAVRAALTAYEAAKGGGVAWYALHSKTGAHVGLWTDKSTPERLLADYPGGTITTLYSALASPASGERDAVIEALKNVRSFVAVMHGSGPDAIIPETIPTPLGIPVKIGSVMRGVDAALRMEGK
jgi:hypothetical protein